MGIVSFIRHTWQDNVEGPGTANAAKLNRLEAAVEALNDAAVSLAEFNALREFTAAEPGEFIINPDGSIEIGPDITRNTALAFYVSLLQPKALTSRLTAASPVVNNNNTTLVDSGLSVTVGANKAYAVEAFIPYRAHADADLRLQWSAPAGVSGWWTPNAIPNTVAIVNGVVNRQASNWASAFTLGGAGTDTSNRVAAMPFGTLVTAATAGTFKLQFMQASQHASDALIDSHAWMRLIELA